MRKGGRAAPQKRGSLFPRQRPTPPLPSRKETGHGGKKSGCESAETKNTARRSNRGKEAEQKVESGQRGGRGKMGSRKLLAGGKYVGEGCSPKALGKILTRG